GSADLDPGAGWGVRGIEADDRPPVGVPADGGNDVRVPPPGNHSQLVRARVDEPRRVAVLVDEQVARAAGRDGAVSAPRNVDILPDQRIADPRVGGPLRLSRRGTDEQGGEK